MLPADLIKNILQEYAQKNSLPLPVYKTIIEGENHVPKFKSSVTINEATYESASGFNNKKASQKAAAKAAVEDLQKQGLLLQFKERKRPKIALAELALKKNIPPPTYHITRTYTATVKINGASYTGGPAGNARDAANKAAFEAIMAIDPQCCNSLSPLELRENNDSEHPSAECNNVNNGSKHSNSECDDSKSEPKMPTESLTSANKLLGGTKSQSTENGLEMLNVDKAPALDKASKKTDVEDPCAVRQDLANQKVKDEHEAEKCMSKINDAHSGPAEQLQYQTQDPFLVQQGHLKKESGDVYNDKEHGSKDTEGKQQSNQKVDLAETITKRSITESENDEEMSPSNKKHKMRKW
eukprot:PITA_16352